jgi:hypothetical protein
LTLLLKALPHRLVLEVACMDTLEHDSELNVAERPVVADPRDVPPAISRISVTSTGSPSFPPIQPASREALGIPGEVLVTAMIYRTAERQAEILTRYLWTIHEC